MGGQKFGSYSFIRSYGFKLCGAQVGEDTEERKLEKERLENRRKENGRRTGEEFGEEFGESSQEIRFGG